MDWDLWLRPGPPRPSLKGRNPELAGHVVSQLLSSLELARLGVDFGTGALGDMACHTCDLPFRALKLGYPTNMEKAETVDFTKDCYQIQSTIRFQFPAREGLAPATLRWYDGGKRRGASFS